MSASIEAITRIHALTRTLEEERNTLATALTTPACSGGVSDAERARLEELHQRLSKAITALSKAARD